MMAQRTSHAVCLSCLRELELGPFFRNPNPRLFNAEAQTPALPNIITPKQSYGCAPLEIDDDGEVIPLDSNDLL